MSNFYTDLNDDDSNYLDIQTTQERTELQPYLLPADHAFLQILKQRHGIELSSTDLKSLSELHFILANENRLKLLHDPNSTHINVQNGKVVGILAFAAIGFFAFPLIPLLGISGLTGALIGASIGWRLFGGKKQQKQEGSTARSAPTFGFDSAPALVPIGGIIPLVFCNRAINPNGGVRTSGSVFYSRVDTFGGVQRLFALYGLCLGEIGYMSENDILINGQPRENFFTDELSTFYKTGNLQQPVNTDADFTYYSQTISASSNNQIGHDKRGFATSSYTNTNSFQVKETDNGNEFETFSPSDRYQVAGQQFRAVRRDAANKIIFTNVNLTFNSGDPIYAMYESRYTTSKKCTEIHLNFVANLWARNNDNKILAHAILADVYVDTVRVTRIYIVGKSESQIRRRLILTNLNYGSHTVKLVPLVSHDDSIQVIKLGDTQTIQTYDTGVTISGKQVQVIYEQENSFSLDTGEINRTLSFDGKQQVSSDRGAPCQLTTVCEVVKPSDLGHSRLANYPGLSYSGLKAVASNRLQGDPSPNFFIYKGIIGRCHVVAGQANIASTSTVLTDLTVNFTNVTVGMVLRNLDKQIESIILSKTSNSITTTGALYWNVGDRYLVYYNDSICYFPDIYVYTLTNSQGGLGSILPGSLMSDFFVDYPSICRARDFCKTNNFYYDGAINESTPWSQWVTRESMTCLLFPTKFGGKFGLIAEGFTEPVMLFNASNITEYSEDYAPKQRLNTVHITYKDGNSDGTTIKFRDKTVSILTQAAFSGIEKTYSEALRFDAITNETQAIRIGQVYLKSRLLQSRVINFTTGLQGFAVTAGDLIIVQHILTEVQKEMSGFITDVSVVSSTVNRVKLSTPLKYGLDANSYSCAVYRTANGILQRDLPVSTILITESGETSIWLEIRGLTDPLNATRDNLAPDYVVVSLNQTERRLYRISAIQPNDDGSVSITAALWTDEILSVAGLVTVN